MITILLPIYNGIEFIDECINSIKAQSYGDWELLIGINGHELNGEAFLKANSFAWDDPRISVFQYDFCNKAKTLNRLMENVCHPSNYIAMMDVDDIWTPEKLERQLHKLESGYDLVSCNAEYFGDKTGFPNIMTGEIKLTDLLYSNHIINSGVLFRQKNDNLKFFENGKWEDYEMWLKMAANGYRIFVMPDFMVKHRLHKDSAFNSNFEGNEISKQYVRRYSPINIVVFSKDRACQLDLFLRSMDYCTAKFCRDILQIKVLYLASDAEYEKGYELLKQQPCAENVLFVKQTDNFKNDVLNLLDNDRKHTVFFTDDDIWINTFDFLSHWQINELDRNKDLLCLSLRLHRHVNYCYSCSQPSERPSTFNESTLVWYWQAHHNQGKNLFDWAYPMSLDGHIFRTNEIKPLIEKLEFVNPNTLEYQLACNPLPNMLMACCEDGKIVNNAINMVQNQYMNRNGGKSAKQLNDAFLDGMQIEHREFYMQSSAYYSVHIEQEFTLLK